MVSETLLCFSSLSSQQLSHSFTTNTASYTHLHSSHSTTCCMPSHSLLHRVYPFIQPTWRTDWLYPMPAVVSRTKLQRTFEVCDDLLWNSITQLWYFYQVKSDSMQKALLVPKPGRIPPIALVPTDQAVTSGTLCKEQILVLLFVFFQ